MEEILLDRDAWLCQALSVLRDEGIQGVRVERLARDLDVTKGSFYWHFQDRDDLLGAILEYWAVQFTSVVTDDPEFEREEPASALLSAMTKVREQELDRYELAMRAWADHDERAEKVVREVYEKRTKFVRRIFERLGFRGQQAEIRTRMTLCFLVAESSMYTNESQDRRRRLLKLQTKLLTTT